MKILVTVAKYSTPEVLVYQSFVRQRNVFYKEREIDVTVLNFFAKDDYVLDDIPVYSLNTYKTKLINENYDLLICHAPNLRNHYRFLKKYERKFPKIVFIFHGHEVLNVNKVYSKPFTFMKKSCFFGRKSQAIYDCVKLNLWRRYYPKLAYKSHFLFVSKWLYDEFIKWTKIPPSTIRNNSSITYNSIGDSFEKENYQTNSSKKYDFITIRGDLDGSKYCIDLVNQLALDNPQFNFLIIGKGQFFNYIPKSPNVEWIDNQLTHEQIISYLNQSRCALMPTRTDAQGLMMCEMATFGIPVITSNIPVCYEVFESFANVRFINNTQQKITLAEHLQVLEEGLPYTRNPKFTRTNTMIKEVQLFRSLVKSSI